MIEAILFDLDGVLVDACDWHYFSLNRALEEVVGFSINRTDHLIKYNGLPTKVKLKMLGINDKESEKIWKLKQEYTIETIREHSKIQNEKIEFFEYLSLNKVKYACVTNSIRETAIEMLTQTGQIKYFDLMITNEDVINNKPSPDCYNKAVYTLDVEPKKCIIVEDSPKGIEAAVSSIVPNKNIWKVQNTQEVTLKNYRRFIDENFNSNGR